MENVHNLRDGSSVRVHYNSDNGSVTYTGPSIVAKAQEQARKEITEIESLLNESNIPQFPTLIERIEYILDAIDASRQ